MGLFSRFWSLFRSSSLEAAALDEAEIESRSAVGDVEEIAPDAAKKAAQWTSVSSSNVQALRFLGRDRLEVMFLSKGRWPRSIYAYFGVPVDFYYQMLNASSKGKFVWRHLRGAYPYARLE